MFPAKKKRKQTASTSENSEKNANSTPPSYGTIDYWNTRYQAVLGDAKGRDGRKEFEDSPSAFHEWYFTYDELRPLLLPLIFGPESHLFLEEGDDQQNEGPEDDEPKSGEKSTKVNHGSNETDKKIDNGSEHHGSEHCETLDRGRGEEVDGSERQSDISDDDESDHEEDDERIEPPGLIGEKPISILEVGCGDCPLTGALAAEVWNASQKSAEGRPFTTSFKDIICSDYSSVVIDVMKKQYSAVVKNNHVQSNQPKAGTLDVRSVCVGNLPLRFEQLDASALPLESNSIELVLEKGTIDAVLSDAKNGIQNATQIMSECARVVSMGGYIVLISHLNAHFPTGLSWLEDVVLPGLKNGNASCNWEIDVHGKDTVTEFDHEDDSTDNDDGVTSDATGPAVYIISKRLPPFGSEKKETVPVRFFSY